MYINYTLLNSLQYKYKNDILRSMRYTFKEFKEEYPDDDACLEAVFQNRYGDVLVCPQCGVISPKFYRVKKRPCYACQDCGYHLYPLAGTIFRKTTTPLWSWFYAIYLFSVAKNGVSAKELERHLGVTYKTAWRMAKQIRLLMSQEDDLIGGDGQIVEADETYIGGKRKQSHWPRQKSVILGAVEKYGQAKAIVASGASSSTAIPFIKASLAAGTVLHTDESRIYNRVKRDYEHKTVNHSKKEYARDGVHTNSIEGFWGQMKRSMDGTYHCISPKYLQHYVNEFTFRYNYRAVAICPVLLARV